MTEVADNTVVDGRYRIVGRIGSGGMADVYKAEDTHLGREVALKVLHRRFAQDQEFVERFRREAKAAAGLQHPHVVGVFDRGEHDGTYYIAMEYLAGRTLKEIVNTQAPLPQETVIDLGLQILAAAGFAHRHNVIHRDFKPHNVIVDDAWQAKVTDFGIARAGASEMTETGSIMGTAQYLSPEQAQGHAVGGTSDLYSIGVMLYEMLTGRVPFEGDSAVAVALKHLSEPPTPVSHLRPDVHPALESVVMAALAKEPAQRWQTAEEFGAALTAARDQIASGAAAPRDTADFAALPVPVAAANGGPPPGERKKERRWPWFTIGIMALALLALLGFLALSGLLAADKKEVPRVVGKQLIEARQQLERAGFEVKTERVTSRADLDDVVEQNPRAGDEADEGSTVTLVVSNGPGNALVPSVKDQTRAQAIRTLEKADFDVTVSDEPSDSVPDGTAVRTFPREGTSVERGSRVRLVMSSGPEQVEVPDVTGLSRGSAEDTLTREGLKVSVREEPADAPEDEVVSQDPAGGTRVDSGARVTITISTGPEQVEVPDVTGLGPSAAARELKAAGLKSVQRDSPTLDQAEDGLVVRQTPDSGSQVDKGSSVVIYVGVLQRHRRASRTRRRPLREGRRAGRRALERARRVARSAAVRARRARARRATSPVEILLERDGRWMLRRRVAGASARRRAARRRRRVPGASRALRRGRRPCRGCSSCWTCPTWAPGWRRRPWRWTSRSSRTCWPRTGCRRWTTRCARHGRPLDLGALALPLFVKPARLGSSVGIAKVMVGGGAGPGARAGLRARSGGAGGAPRGGGRGGVLGARASRPDRLTARRDRAARGQRLVRLRGQVRVGRHGADRARPAAGGRARDACAGCPLEVFGIVGCSGMARVDFFVEDGRVCWSTS